VTTEWVVDLYQAGAHRTRRQRLRIPGWLTRTVRTPQGTFGLTVVGLVAVAALVSVFWTPHPLLQADPSLSWSPPSWQHLLGTDQIGRDTFSWLLAGSRTTVAVVSGATVLAGVLGIGLGSLTASLRPRYAEPLIVVVDILVAFPVLLIAMLLATPFGGSITVVVIAVGVGAGLNLARVVRSEIVRVNVSDYILASRAAGTGAINRLRQHVLPNVAPVVVVQLSVTAGLAILAEAGLTFLGYGAAPEEPSWGRVLADAQKYIGVAPASVIWPGVTIGVAVLALNLLGDALGEALDPRLELGVDPDGA
jgi:peptide/nickel transport system permease protein